MTCIKIIYIIFHISRTNYTNNIKVQQYIEKLYTFLQSIDWLYITISLQI